MPAGVRSLPSRSRTVSHGGGLGGGGGGGGGGFTGAVAGEPRARGGCWDRGGGGGGAEEAAEGARGVVEELSGVDAGGCQVAAEPVADGLPRRGFGGGGERAGAEFDAADRGDAQAAVGLLDREVVGEVAEVVAAALGRGRG